MPRPGRPGRIRMGMPAARGEYASARLQFGVLRTSPSAISHPREERESPFFPRRPSAREGGLCHCEDARSWSDGEGGNPSCISHQPSGVIDLLGSTGSSGPVQKIRARQPRAPPQQAAAGRANRVHTARDSRGRGAFCRASKRTRFFNFNFIYPEMSNETYDH
jgi:hypothetical protein